MLTRSAYRGCSVALSCAVYFVERFEMVTKIASKVVVLAALVSVVGCASNSELAKVRSEAELARQTADQALRTAEDAKQTAQDADMKASRAEEMLNRGFKRSMYK